MSSPQRSPVYKAVAKLAERPPAGQRQAPSTLPRAGVRHDPITTVAEPSKAKDDFAVGYEPFDVDAIDQEKAKLEMELESLKRSQDELQSLKAYMDMLQRSPLAPTEREIKQLTERLDNLDIAYRLIDDMNNETEEDYDIGVEEEEKAAVAALTSPDVRRIPIMDAPLPGAVESEEDEHVVEEDAVPQWTVVRSDEHTSSQLGQPMESAGSRQQQPPHLAKTANILRDLTKQMDELGEIQGHISQMQDQLNQSRASLKKSPEVSRHDEVEQMQSVRGPAMFETEEEDAHDSECDKLEQAINDDIDTAEVERVQDVQKAYEQWLESAKLLESSLKALNNAAPTGLAHDTEVTESATSGGKEYSVMAQDGSEGGGAVSTLPEIEEEDIQVDTHHLAHKTHKASSAGVTHRQATKEKDHLCEEMNLCIDYYLRSHSKPAVRLLHVLLQHLTSLPEANLPDALRLVSAYTLHVHKTATSSHDKVTSSHVSKKPTSPPPAVNIPSGVAIDESKAFMDDGDLVAELAQKKPSEKSQLKGKDQESTQPKSLKVGIPAAKLPDESKKCKCGGDIISELLTDKTKTPDEPSASDAGITQLKERLSFRFPKACPDRKQSYDYAESVTSSSSAPLPQNIPEDREDSEMSVPELKDLMVVGSEEDLEGAEAFEQEIGDLRREILSDTSSLTKEAAARVEHQFGYVESVLHDLSREFGRLVPEDTDVEDGGFLNDSHQAPLMLDNKTRLADLVERVGELVVRRTQADPQLQLKERIAEALSKYEDYGFGGAEGLTYCKLIHEIMTILLDEILGGDDVAVAVGDADDLAVQGRQMSIEEYAEDFEDDEA